jgi:hypothetical protein
MMDEQREPETPRGRFSLSCLLIGLGNVFLTLVLVKSLLDILRALLSHTGR